MSSTARRAIFHAGWILMVAAPIAAQEKAVSPVLEATRALTGMEPGSIDVPLRAFFLVTILSVVPSIALLATCYPRILIVLSFLRRALGTPDLPSNQILAGLTLILTGMIMMPVWKRVHAEAYLPLSRGEIKTTEEALLRASVPVKQFMLEHTLERDLRLFVETSREPEGNATSRASTNDTRVPPTGSSELKVEELGFFVVLPAFVLSEIKLAFQMGFLLYLPFLVIDIAVSTVLISMGMFLLPPVMVSLPLKVLVFVLADGWNLVVEQLIQGFRVLV